MVNLADITRESGRGSGLDAMARQWGLDQAQTTRAVEALLPAFSLAFQRLALNPIAFAEITKTIGSGVYAPFFDNPGQPQAAARGSDLVAQLFRSPEAAQQIATQAAAMTGVGVQVMQQIMPTLAATLVGGMFRYATVEGFADLLRQWGDALRAISEKLDPPKPQDPWSAWQAAASRMMGLPSPAPTPSPRPSPPPEPASVLDAWMGMVGAMMGSAASVAQPAPASRPEARESVQEPLSNGAGDEVSSSPASLGVEEPSKGPASAGSPNPFEAMSQMFETGREVQTHHLAALQSILDNVWGTAKR